MKREGKRERLAELKEEAASLFEVQRSSDAERLVRAIKLGQVLREAKKLLVQGSFAKWCRSEIRYEKSQCHDAMMLYDCREDIPEAQQWADRQGIPATTMSDTCKMLRKWRRRNEVTPTASVATRRHTVANITDNQRSKIYEAHNCLGAEPIDDIQVGRAEIVLLKLAVAYRVTVDRLLKAVGLKIPPQWEAHIQEELFGHADTSDSIEADAIEPDLPSAVSSGGSVLPEVPANDSDPVESPSSFSVKKENSFTSSIGAKRYRSIPGFERLSTGKRASRKACENGLNMIIEFGRSGTSHTRISNKLKALDLNVSSTQISSILLRENKAPPKAA